MSSLYSMLKSVLLKNVIKGNNIRSMSSGRLKEYLLRISPDSLKTKDDKEVHLKADLLVKFENTDYFEDCICVKYVLDSHTNAALRSSVKKSNFEDLKRDVKHIMSEDITAWSGKVVKFDITSLGPKINPKIN